MNFLFRSIAATLLSLPLLGCGTSSLPVCTLQGFKMLVRPSDPIYLTHFPDHLAAPPGNQETFIAALGSTFGPGCVSNELYQPVHAMWTTSDPVNTSISSADDATNGVATCLAATAPGGATISATLTSDGFTESVASQYPLICK